VKGIEAFPLESRAEIVPVQYTPDDWTDLSHYLRPHADDPDASLAAWTKGFVAGDQDQTVDVLRRMLITFRDAFTYRSRESQGTQSPGETLRTRSGTCRDYAWLMIEALRRLGFASRFVSGYLYDEAPDGGTVGMTSALAQRKRGYRCFFPVPAGSTTIRRIRSMHALAYPTRLRAISFSRFHAGANANPRATVSR